MSVVSAELRKLLSQEGFTVRVVPTNSPLPKALSFAEHVKGIRAILRFLFFILHLFRAARGADLFHVLANSYLNFPLFTVPAVVVAKVCRCKVIINYHGGKAREFLEKYDWLIRRFLLSADAITVPSQFLANVFQVWGYKVWIVPNTIDVDKFGPQNNGLCRDGSVRLLVVRNLERIYNIECAIRAFELIQKQYTEAELAIVGEGNERGRLENIVSTSGLKGVSFLGKRNNWEMPDIYRSATILLNASDADNQPVSVLEAFASRVPVVSTSVGGIPYLIKNGVTGLLVSRGDHFSMALSVLKLLSDEELYASISSNAHNEALRFTWEAVRPKLLSVYEAVLTNDNPHFRLASRSGP